MKIFKSIGDIALCFLAIISVLITVGYGFYSYFVNDITIGVNNISDQLAIDIKAEKDLSEMEKLEYEERWFMEANYYSNKNNNGIELQELNFNYFASHKLEESDYRATGMQYVGDYSYSSDTAWSDFEIQNMLSKGFTYYDTVDGISFNGHIGNYASVGTMLNRKEAFVIKIDNRPFTIQLTGTEKHGWDGLWGLFQTTEYYEYGTVFECVMKAIETNSAGYGDYYLTLDLSRFFSIKEMTPDGKFTTDNVTDIIKNYAVIKFHYDENGASRSGQSIFGQINCNKVFDTEKVDYWQERMVYTLTEEDLTYRYSEAYDGYFVSLDAETKKLFDSMPTTKLLLDFDFTSLWCEDKGYNVIGFDYNAFSGFYIDTLTIKSAPTTLYVKDSAFDDATVKTLKHSAGITWDGLTNIGWEVVVL